jgi:hypothetical protein
MKKIMMIILTALACLTCEAKYQMTLSRNGQRTTRLTLGTPNQRAVEVQNERREANRRAYRAKCARENWRRGYRPSRGR